MSDNQTPAQEALWASKDHDKVDVHLVTGQKSKKTEQENTCDLLKAAYHEQEGKSEKDKGESSGSGEGK